MKPQYERVTFPKGCSLRVYQRQVSQIPFEWHHHPEFELTLTINSRGWRFIGDHIGQYDALDLVLVPPDMPHTWASTNVIDEKGPHTANVVWFSRAWALRLADLCPEFSAISKLLSRASAGLSFSPPAGALMHSRLPELLSNSPQRRLHGALELLTQLADMEGLPLATSEIAVRPTLGDEPAQLNRVLDFLHKHFCESIRVEDLCSIGNLSARSLHRLFVRHIGGSVTDYLNKLRIGRACMLLVQTDSPVGMIAAESGFPNLANFNRHFRNARQMTPTEFRRYFVKHGRLPDASNKADLTKRPPSLDRANRRQVKQAVGKVCASPRTEVR